MDVRFAHQPFADGEDFREFIESVAESLELTDLTVIVAWAKERGFARVEQALKTITARGASRLIVGIDEGGATAQGLQRALKIFDEVFVFHDRAGRTFHPKVYVASGSQSATILVGSHNLTPGGVYFNYEAGVVVDADLSLKEDLEFVQSVQKFIQRLMDDSDVCLRLDNDLLQELVSNPRYRIGDEDAGRAGAQLEVDPLDTTVDVEVVSDELEVRPSVFGKSANPKKRRPQLIRSPGDPKQAAKETETKPNVREPARATGSPGAIVIKRWFKVLSNSDAQQRGTPSTQTTGNLKLTQARHPIDHKSYFRSDFFAPLKWTGRGVKEEATLQLEVYVDTQPLGTMQVRVDHVESRVSGQGNVATWLHWDDLGRYLQGNNHAGDVVTIEYLSNGDYRLTIANSETGPFIE
jgi:HKD family nuclease